MPRILIWLTGILGVSQLFALFFVLSPADSTNGMITRFDQASRCEEKPSLAPLNSDGIAAMLDQPALIQKDCWHPVTLPENNPAQDVKVDLNNPQLRRTWYRVRYPVPEDWAVTKPLMVYVPRVIANAWQIRIDGQSLEDNRFDWRSTWNRPVAAIFFAETSLPNRTLVIDVGVIASEAEGFSIARISVGDANVLRRHKAYREYLQVIMPQAASTVMLLLGFFSLTFWLARRAETEFLLLAFASLAFSILNLKYALTQSDDPALDAWYSTLISDGPIPWINYLVYLFIARIAGFTFRWIERLLWLQVIVISLITLSPISLQQDYSLVKNTSGFIVAIIGNLIIIWQAIVTRNIGLRVIAVSLVLGVFGGVHDIVLSLNLINPEGLYLGPYFELANFAAFLFAIQRRYVAAITGQERLNVDLAQRLTERDALTQRLTASEAELRAQHSHLRELERAQTLAEERQRLMHDMHDGLGSSLLSTLAAIEKNNLPQQAVAEALRACIEDLRLVIDSLEPMAHDLVTLLATIRYRLGQRLDAAGLELKWEINDLPPLPWLEPPDALNVLRLVQEALVNVLKHANASSVRVATRDLGQQVEIQIDDNGCGFDPKTITLGRGMRSQTKRAERLGGELQVESTLGRGTSLRLLLPISKVSKS
ncbi:MAG: sensor histidine kinase [Methylococcaceae bacterium]